jgi:membrane-associated phospholipid phosphatase
MDDKNQLRPWLLAFLATIIAVVVCVIWIDRPVADFVELHLRHTAFWIVVAAALSPISILILAALLFLLSCGAWLLRGRQLARWTRVPLLCSWATMWAVAAEIILKRIFGRGWPDPTYTQEHLYGFHWLHGTPHWDSLPSGTAAISLAILMVLWSESPRWRVVGSIIVALLDVAVVLNNYHWVSDVLAGAFLGFSIGWMTVRLQAAQH